MQKFLYKARDRGRRMVEGRLEAETEQEALAKLGEVCCRSRSNEKNRLHTGSRFRAPPGYSRRFGVGTSPSLRDSWRICWNRA